MLVLPAAASQALGKPVKKPIYVLEILWADGSHGVEGVNDVYFATTAVTSITNFPYPNSWFPFLDETGISAVSQQLDPINGVSTIGSMTFMLSGTGGTFGQIVRAAEAASHGLRRQRCELYMLFDGQDWADRVKIRALQVTNLKQRRATGDWQVSASDTQFNLKRNVFQPSKPTMLTSSILSTDTTGNTFTVQDASGVHLTTQNVGGVVTAVAYVKVDKEIISISAVSGTTLTISQRGLMGTQTVAHDLATASGFISVQEIVYLHGNPIHMALDMLTAGTSGTPIVSGLPESPHPYPNSTIATQQYTHSTAVGALYVTFDSRTYTEVNYDKIYVNEWDGIAWVGISATPARGYFWGSELAGKEVAVTGDRFQVMLESDISINYWGYKVTQVSELSTSGGMVFSAWGLALDPTSAPPDLDKAAFEALGTEAASYDATDITKGIQFEFAFDKGTDGKKFLEHEILRPLGLFTFVDGNGALSVRRYSDLSNTNLAAIPVERTLTSADIINWTDLDYLYNQMANVMVIDYDVGTDILAAKTTRTIVFVDQSSRTVWGASKPLKIKVIGLRSTAANLTMLFDRFIRYMASLSRPPLSFSVTCTHKWFSLQVGDTVRLQLPTEDITTGADLDRVFEVISTSLVPHTGNVSLKLKAQPSTFNKDAIVNSYTSAQIKTVASAYAPAGATVVAAGTYANLSWGTIDQQTVYSIAGDITITGTLTISGSVILYCNGTVTFSKTSGVIIDGNGKGSSGITTQTYTGGSKKYVWGAANSSHAGFVGVGGNGSVVYEPAGYPAGNAGFNGSRLPPVHNTAPSISVYGATTDTATPPKWTSFGGVPSQPLWGQGGGSGGSWLAQADGNAPAGAAAIGGNGGAGFMMIAKGLNIVSTATNVIDMQGAAGSNWGAGSGGGGGGGTFIALLELQATMTNVFSNSAVTVAGGAGGTHVRAGAGGGSHSGYNGTAGYVYRGVF